MKCENCGHKIKQKDRQFCPECGTDVSGHIQEHRKKRKKTLLLTGIPVILVAGLVIGFFVYGKMTFSPQNTIDDFSEAVEDGDANALTDLLTSNDDSFSIDEDNARILSDYLSEHDDDMDAIEKNLKEQADSPDEDSENASDETYAAIQLKKEGSKWGLFEDYKLSVTPAYIDIYSENKGIEVYINDEKVATTPEDEYFEDTFGPFMPGTYTIKGKLDTSYSSAEEAEDVNLFNMDEETTKHELAMDVSNITVISNFDEGYLYVDDDKTDIKIGHGTQAVGPFSRKEPIDLKVVQEMPWGPVESETKTVYEDDKQVGLDRDSIISDEAEEELFQTVNDVLATYTEAITKSDASLLQDNVTENFQEELNDKIKEEKKNNPDYEGKLVKTRYDSRWYQDPEYDEDREAYMFELTLHFIRHETSGDHLGDVTDYDKKNHTKYKRNLIMLFDEDDEEWKVDSMDTSYGVIGYDDHVYELD